MDPISIIMTIDIFGSIFNSCYLIFLKLSSLLAGLSRQSRTCCSLST